jgi:hypothetical protein
MTLAFFVIVFGVAILAAIFGHLVSLPAGTLPSLNVVLLACLTIMVLIVELLLFFIQIILPRKIERKKSE